MLVGVGVLGFGQVNDIELSHMIIGKKVSELDSIIPLMGMIILLLKKIGMMVMNLKYI